MKGVTGFRRPQALTLALPLLPSVYSIQGHFSWLLLPNYYMSPGNVGGKCMVFNSRKTQLVEKGSLKAHQYVKLYSFMSIE